MSNNQEHAKRVDGRIVDTLQRLYAIVIALALATGVRILIESIGILPGGALPLGQGIVGPKLVVSLIFVAFLSTVIAFYHGMNRHLDETYIFGDNIDHRRITLMIDIVVFVVEAGLLFVMASTINQPGIFLASWSILLGVDIVWSVVVFLSQRTEKPLWAANNAVWLVVAWVCWQGLFPQNAVCIAIVELLRSAADYRLHWNFYFPKSLSDSSTENN